jgi:hypothetical protein
MGIALMLNIVVLPAVFLDIFLNVTVLFSCFFTFMLRGVIRNKYEERNNLKVPKHEIFGGGFFASKEPIWSPDP